MRPHVILHNSTSADARIAGFDVDMGRHYGLLSGFSFQAHLAGSRTICGPDVEIPPETEAAFEAPAHVPDDSRPLLVVPDSRGAVRNWHSLREAPFWRGFVALCSETTPTEYRRYLEERHVDCLVVGADRVDLGRSLTALAERYGVDTVLLDGGGTLNGVMLRAGLVDELSVLVHPRLVGGDAVALVHEPKGPARSQRLELIHHEALPDGLMWLRYAVLPSD